ncbi:MAG: hypothetical protein WC861_00695 [Candidatus Micrarchaeia archaeon]
MISITTGPILKSPNGNLEIVAIFDKKDRKDPNRALSFPEMFKKYQGKLATFKQLSPFFVDSTLWNKNRGILRKAKPMVTRTVGALSRKLPLCELPTENGKIYIEKEFNGKTRFGGFTVDQLVKAGIRVDVPGVFLAMEQGYVIGDVSASGSNYTMHIPSDVPPEQLKTFLHAFYGDFENGQLRRTDNALSIPVGAILEGNRGQYSPGQDALYFAYDKPGPASQSFPDFYDCGGRGYGVRFGSSMPGIRRGGAVIMQK